MAVRDPRTGISVQRGHADSDDAVRAAKVMTGLPDPTNGGAANNYVDLPGSSRTTPTRPAARSTCAISPTMSAFARYGWRDLATNDQTPIPLPCRRQRQRRDLRAQQAARARRDVHAEHHVAARSPLRVVVDRRRQEPAGARLDERVRRVRHQRPARRIRASPAACRRSSSPASRISAGRRPTRSGSTRGVESEGELHAPDGTALAEDRLRVSRASRPKCRT